MKFSIKSKSVEHCGEIEGIEGDYCISVCYDGQDHIYLINGVNALYIAYHSIKKKYHPINIASFSACHDSNGTFYIYDQNHKRFIKYNVEEREVTELNAIPSKNDNALLMYHRESSISSFIYSFGGAKYGNFKYSIEEEQWEPFLKDDKYDRYVLSNATIEKFNHRWHRDLRGSIITRFYRRNNKKYINRNRYSRRKSNEKDWPVSSTLSYALSSIYLTHDKKCLLVGAMNSSIQLLEKNCYSKIYEFVV
ncbi:hypothetical protein PPL_08280 [Heterostelium album PN500]|uniref:Uncharacterized protein n=1 Tax=Heterostelium pallidum (strain ATCC 26659 / Pp 5 / PN500) TaxID=670386 RepID=D3BHR6_HETP5|nr:hypothetical protein PPL_08280 [Heterostelium album PN500]EFA78816.1 hypothetical protein PPL_08280 [Heterostelium album PN500]|eukprot:XP_020430940.1 hypothetical protein PPL_08280 [Heterostelium album PN500]